jgi:aconitate hydratase
MLPLTFADAADYDKVREDDGVSIIGLTTFAPGVPLTLLLRHSDGTTNQVKVNHTFNENQIGWFRAGSALNLIAAQGAIAKAKRKPGRKAKSLAKKKRAKVVRKKIAPKRKKVAAKKGKPIARTKGGGNSPKRRKR